MESVIAPIGLAVVGAGYWGPNLVRNAMSTPSVNLRWLCDLDEDRARRVLGPTRRSRRPTPSTPCSRTRDGPCGRHRDPGRHPLPARGRGARRRQARPRREAADVVPRRREEARAGGRGSRAGPHVRPHLLLHAGRAGAAPARARRRRWARSSSSTPSGSTSGWCSPTSTCSGTSPRTTCRSSTSSCPRGVASTAVSAQGADPIGHGHGLRRLPHAAALDRGHGARPRQLAEPDQDPARW